MPEGHLGAAALLSGRPAKIVPPRGGDVDLRRQLELEFWRRCPEERPGANSIDNLLAKLVESRTLLALLRRFEARFARAQAIVELGAGQGWGACLVKRLHPHAAVLATDLSAEANASVEIWERVFEVSLDGVAACPAEALPLPDASQDLVFCYQAAHHFIRHRSTLRELHRVLRPGGSALYLFEPACPSYLYRAAVARVNHRRAEVAEDVLRHRELCRLGQAAGFDSEVEFYPDSENRGAAETLYYSMLARAPWLCPRLPCTANFVFTKP